MASTTSISTTYAGVHATGYITAALFDGKTLSKQAVTFLTGVKDKIVLPNANLGNIMQAYNCDWTPNGTFSLTETIGTVTELESPFQQCKSQLLGTWESMEMGPGSLTQGLPANFTEFLINRIVASTAQENEFNLWRGNFTGATTALSGYTKYTGLLRQLDTNAAVTKITKSAVTASNVNVILQSIYGQIPDQIRDKEDLFFYTSKNVTTAYRLALNSNNLQQFDTDRGTRFMDLVIEDFPGIPDNVFVVGLKSNAYFLTDLISDFQSVKVVDTSDTLNDDNIRIKLLYKCGTQIANGAEFLLVR